MKTLRVFALLAVGCVNAFAAQDLDIVRQVDASGFPKAIPVALSGFTGEADSVIRFDLFFMGFTFVPQDQARFVIQGNNANGRVEGRVLDPLARKYLLAKAYASGSTRSQVHALADEIAQLLTGRPGIAQTQIAFKVQPTGSGRGEIFVSDYDGHNPQQVTQDSAIIAAPSWAGRSALCYVSYKFDKPDIFSHQLRSGARKAVARYPGSNISPAVSPDGKRIAMILSKSGSPDLYVSDIDGSNLRQLTTTKEDESSPCWSPDGQTICVVSRQSGRAQLYTIPASGGGMKRLPTEGAINTTEPDWSPDGKFIVFTANMGGFQICYVPLDGPRRGMAETGLTAGEDPVWAPNSRAVLFSRTRNRVRVLSLLDVPSKQVKDVARISGSASQPSWAR